MSGEMLRPRCSKSSPVLATTSRSSGRQHAAEAERQLGAADAAGQRDDQAALHEAAHRNMSSARRTDEARGRDWPAPSRRGRAPARPAAPRRPGPSRSEAAAAISSAKPMMLTCRVRPNRSGLPRRSSSAGRPAAPMRDAGGAAPPGAAETVGDDHRQRRAAQRAPARARSVSALPSGSTGSSRTRSTPSVGADIGLVDAGIGHDEAQPVLDDQHVGPRRARRAPIRTGSPRPAAGPSRPRRPSSTARAEGIDRGEIDAAALGLGDDLLRHHEHVAGARRQRAARQPAAIRARQVVARPDQREGRERAQRARARLAAAHPKRLRSRGSTCSP